MTGAITPTRRWWEWISRGGGAPGTPSAWETPPPAPSPRRLTLSGGFAVLDTLERRLRNRAVELGFTDLRAYLAARCQQQCLAELARELGTTTAVIRLPSSGSPTSPATCTAA